jgi:hypothetical protein
MTSTTPHPARPAAPGVPPGPPTACDDPIGDLAALPRAVHSEYVKLTTLRSNTAIAVPDRPHRHLRHMGHGGLVKDEVLVISDVFVYSDLPDRGHRRHHLRSSRSPPRCSTEHHTALTAQPARWVLVAAKTVIAVRIGVVLEPSAC